MNHPHETQGGWPVRVRNIDVLGTHATDTGYNWEERRVGLRTEDVTPLINQRDPGLRGWARTMLWMNGRLTDARRLIGVFRSPTKIRRHALIANLVRPGPGPRHELRGPKPRTRFRGGKPVNQGVQPSPIESVRRGSFPERSQESGTFSGPPFPAVVATDGRDGTKTATATIGADVHASSRPLVSTRFQIEIGRVPDHSSTYCSVGRMGRAVRNASRTPFRWSHTPVC